MIAGKEYGTGSSRDWAAKGTLLLGVKAVLVESFERIHRSNLVGMGVLPLQFLPGENAVSLGLTGAETFDLIGIAAIAPGAQSPCGRQTMARSLSSRPSSGSTVQSRWSTTATAASCKPCCAA